MGERKAFGHSAITLEHMRQRPFLRHTQNMQSKEYLARLVQAHTLHLPDYAWSPSGLSRTLSMLSLEAPQLAAHHTTTAESTLDDVHRLTSAPTTPKQRMLVQSITACIHGAQPRGPPRRAGTPRDWVRQAREARASQQARARTDACLSQLVRGGPLRWSPSNVASERRHHSRVAKTASVVRVGDRNRACRSTMPTMPYYAKLRAKHREQEMLGRAAAAAE